jgi:hypothetical protein
LKKYIGILSISLFALSVIFCNVYFFGSMLIAKYEANHSGNLEQISLSESQVQSIHGHEISIDGQMYDIIKLEKIGNKTIATAYKDSRETELLSLFKKTKNSKSEILLLSFLSLVVNTDLHSFDFTQHNTCIAYTTCHEKVLTSTFIGVLSPPPDFFT